MTDKELFIKNVVSIANIEGLIKLSIKKVGLEHIAPLTESVQNEKISKNVNRHLSYYDHKEEAE